MGRRAAAGHRSHRPDASYRGPMDADATVRLATPADADHAARLLDDFNREFDTPSQEPAVLAPRLRTLLAGEATFALLAGDPPQAIALVTLRPNVWYDGRV